MRISKGLLTLLLGFTLILVMIGLRSYVDHSRPVPVVVREGQMMGTLWSMQIVADDDSKEKAEAALDAAFGELDRIERLMSEWRPDSPISAVNQAAGSGVPVEVPQELADMIRRGIHWGEVSHGAFDITWRSMGNIWHFDEDFVPPTPEEVAEARARVDYRKIKIDGNRVSLPKDVAIGLGGIAKGYSINRAGTVIRDAGFDEFLVNGGGDVLTSGEKGTRPWKIGIRDPRGAQDELIARIQISDGAVVTSGDYERFRIVNGVRYHHIIDPRTGYPADKCQSVTVVAPDAETADVLATTVFVLGPDAGLRLVSTLQNVQAFVVGSNGRYYMTDDFRSVAEFRDN